VIYCLLESIFCFKGKSAPTIALIEIGLTGMKEIDHHQLFVGLTRAQIVETVAITQNAKGVMGL
jgi:hypothetical protein